MSPQCDWDWKSSPKPWVNELVAALRAASFVDHKGVYLTECSMGGMGVWEVEESINQLLYLTLSRKVVGSSRAPT